MAANTKRTMNAASDISVFVDFNTSVSVNELSVARYFNNVLFPRSL